MIRKATKDDIEIVRDMAIQEMERLGWSEPMGLEPDKYSVESLIRYHVRHKDAIVLVAEREGKPAGFLIGSLQICFVDIRRHAAHEKLSGGEDVGELWAEFERWAKEKEAPFMVRSCYHTCDMPRLRKVV